MKQTAAKVFDVALETWQETGRTGQAAHAIEAAGGVVLTCCSIRKRIVYVAPRSLETEIAAVFASVPGDRVS